MKKLKMLAVALGTVVVTSSALAVPTLTIWDAALTTTVAAVGGIANYVNSAFDSGQWSIVISTAETKPAIGSALAPVMDLSVQATSLGGGRNLNVSWSDNAFGPFNSKLGAQLSGHVVTGTGSTVLYNTYYDAANGPVSTGGTIAGGPTPYTTSGLLAPSTYSSFQGGATINNSAFGLTELLTITSVPGGSYSLDASLSGVPDGGTTVMLLGAALSGLAILRRKMA
jgi:hypothetical protein